MSIKVAVVTGANKGLGFATVKALCSQFDGTVYLTSRDKKRGNDACGELKKSGLKPEFYQLDVTDEESIARFSNFIKEKHGQIDILINNAGILFLKDSTAPKLYQAEQTVKINFFSLVKFTEAMLPLIKNGGKILNITSSSGHLSRIPDKNLRAWFNADELSWDELERLMLGYVMAVQMGIDREEGWSESPYVMSKVAVNAYTFMLHKRLSDRDISVNCVHPGYVISDMTHGAGSVTPDEAAKLVLKLVLEPCEGGRYIWHNGAAVPWDGPDPRGYIDGQQV